MIPNLTHGSGFRGLLTYLLIDLETGKPRLGAKLLGGTLVGVSVDDLVREFGLVRRLHPNAEKVVVHHSLSYTLSENPSDEQILRDAARYLEHMGMGDNPHVVVVHRDKDHVHCHIPSCKIGFDGAVWNAWRDAYRAQVSAACVEREFGLPSPPRPGMQIAIERKWKSLQEERPEIKALPPNPIPKLGDEGVMAEIRSRIESLPPSLPLPEFVRLLELEGVALRPSIGGNTISGWRVQLLGSDSAPEKLSKVHKKLSWKNLQDSGRVIYDPVAHLEFARKLQEVPFDKPLEPRITSPEEPYPRRSNSLLWDWQPDVPIPTLERPRLVAGPLGFLARPGAHTPGYSRGVEKPSIRRPKTAATPGSGLGENRPTVPHLAARISAPLGDLQRLPSAWGAPDSLGSGQHVDRSLAERRPGNGIASDSGIVAGRPGTRSGLPDCGPASPGSTGLPDPYGVTAGRIPIATKRSPGSRHRSNRSWERVDRGGVAPVATVRTVPRVQDPWDCVALDLRHLDASLGLDFDREAALEKLANFERPSIQVGATPEWVAAASLVARERALSWAQLQAPETDHLAAEASVREFLWDQASQLLLPATLYPEIRSRVHDHPLESFGYQNGALVLHAPNHVRPVRQAFEEALTASRSRVVVPELPAVRTETELWQPFQNLDDFEIPPPIEPVDPYLVLPGKITEVAAEQPKKPARSLVEFGYEGELNEKIKREEFQKRMDHGQAVKPPRKPKI